MIRKSRARSDDPMAGIRIEELQSGINMKIRIVLTTASLTLLILVLRQTEWAQSKTINSASNQSNEPQKKPRNANEYDQNARMGMYYAVMCELSSADGQTEQAKV